MEYQHIKDNILTLVNSIALYDQLERDHIKDIANWIASGENIFRIKKDAIPPKHLVSYSVAVDVNERKIFLLDHKKALLKLPSGCHPEKNEMPYATARRELEEELPDFFDLPFLSGYEKTPFFATVDETVGISEHHTDASLWYVFKGDSSKSICEDSGDFLREFDGWHWMSFNEILSTPIKEFNPQMHRFVQKLEKHLNKL